jgi:hypothetical protein
LRQRLQRSDISNGLSKGDDLAGVYIQHVLPVMQEQLLKAGIRLAKIIDENF